MVGKAVSGGVGGVEFLAPKNWYHDAVWGVFVSSKCQVKKMLLMLIHLATMTFILYYRRTGNFAHLVRSYNHSMYKLSHLQIKLLEDDNARSGKTRNA